jgi:spore coat protein U-like protein
MQRLLHLACVLGCFAAPQAHAQSANGSFAVNANVVAGCFVDASTVNFGTLPPGAATPQVDAVGSIVVTCSNGIAYTIALDRGANNQGANRRMRHATLAQFLIYDLYRDAARTQRWRDTPGQDVSGTASGASQSLPVYARLPAGQTPPAGAYLDTVTAIVRY